ncbi:MAG TPA: ATPase, T2SS/T4P/T4SS family, partial [Oligoflexia bacterium]|nr:ATPase, T2SS/T4P/T4SS family [Oligoflexia bacterium]
FDILTPLVENTEVNDVIVRAYNDISIQIGRRNIQTDLRFAGKDAYKAFVENLLKRAGKACTLSTPVVDAALTQNIRACVTHESFSPAGSGPMLTLRIARHGAISLEGLAVRELAPPQILDYLSVLVKSAQATLLIAGEVGTGKTTLIKALASRIDPEEAILVIEDTHELALDRPFVRTLLTREANTEGAGRITPAQAIRTGMRMAMNRVILGEMRDGEAAEAFIDVCASGHPGMSTIHARSARDALLRLELFLSRAQGNVTIDTVRRQIAHAISAVVYLGVDKAQRKRRIMSVVEVGTAADGAVQLSPVFSYAPSGPFAEWIRESGISFFTGTLHEHAVVLPLPGQRIGFDPDELYCTSST